MKCLCHSEVVLPKAHPWDTESQDGSGCEGSQWSVPAFLLKQDFPEARCTGLYPNCPVFRESSTTAGKNAAVLQLQHRFNEHAALIIDFTFLLTRI